ncbi:hypothetical protein DPMN_144691 [Dreissena polymorpha]|uniref:Uncharacterized protein n=1 Tax=Dreissena polymorpha TaxID=45954 RepID=A0A9D4IWT6_DREPO|nr:hypothetical protein DPMN_144691 [Dreissena polymorpha]
MDHLQSVGCESITEYVRWDPLSEKSLYPNAYEWIYHVPTILSPPSLRLSRFLDKTKSQRGLFFVSVNNHRGPSVVQS